AAHIKCNAVGVIVSRLDLGHGVVSNVVFTAPLSLWDHGLHGVQRNRQQEMGGFVHRNSCGICVYSSDLASRDNTFVGFGLDYSGSGIIAGKHRVTEKIKTPATSLRCHRFTWHSGIGAITEEVVLWRIF